MKYGMVVFIRRKVMLIRGKSCDTCQNYNGRFGKDCCFRCEHSYSASGYKKVK